MSSIFVVPVDPASPKSSSVDGLDTQQLWSSLPQGSKPPKAGSTHVFFGTPSPGSQNITALTSLGPSFSKQSTPPDAKRELVRTAVGSAVQQLKALGDGVHGRTVQVDVAAGDSHAAAVAAHLAAYDFTLKSDDPFAHGPRDGKRPAQKFTFAPLPAGADKKAWSEGVEYAEAQNFARTLMELPANLLTPTLFTETVKREFNGVKGVEIIVRDAGAPTRSLVLDLSS